MTQQSLTRIKSIASQPVLSSQPRGCRLIWRQNKLIVQVASPSEGVSLPPLSNLTWLSDCLRRSPVTLVILDPHLGEDQIKLWADACQAAQKSVYVRVSSIPHLPHKTCPLNWQLKRGLDWIAALSLLLVLSPVMLWLTLLIYMFSPGPIFYQQWRVGERGKLFKITKFRTMMIGAERLHHQVMGQQEGLHKLKDDPRVTSLGRWMRKYSLDELPQLFNVVRGEMSLVGPRPWALYDSVRITPNLQHRLNALPGMTGAWQVQSRSTSLDLNAVNQGDLKYLRNWSIWLDFKFLVLTVPKVLSGFGAY
jgi:lipopolysaccharide/colanic/teichoic acid biosynthesis glycosyltransferase